jgi:hypothetical protein
MTVRIIIQKIHFFTLNVFESLCRVDLFFILGLFTALTFKFNNSIADTLVTETARATL